MFLLGTLGLFAFLLAQAGAAPTKDRDDLTVYQSIEKTCPLITAVPQNEIADEFKECNSLKEIKAIDSLTNEESNKLDVNCLIYYNAFVTYCTKTEHLSNSVPKNLDYTLDQVCENLDVIGKVGDGSAHLHKLLKNKDDCKKVCGFFGAVTPPCKKAYYYINLNTLKIQAQTKSKTVDSVSSKLPAENVAASSLANPVPGVSSTSSKTDVKESPIDAKSPTSNGENTANANVLNSPSGPVGDQPKIPFESVADAVNSGFAENPVQAANSGPPAHSNPAVDPAASAVQSPPAADLPPAAAAAGNTNDAKKTSVAIQAGSETQGQIVPSKSAEPGTGAQGQEPPVLDVDGEVDPPQPQSVKNKETADVVNKAPGASAGNGAETNNGIGEVKNDEKKLSEDAGLDDDSMGADNDDTDQQEYMAEKESNPVKKPAYSEPVAPDANKPDDSVPANYSSTVDEGDSYFFTFFMLLCVVFIVGYISYHNKQKILALILEGRRGKRQYRSRRPNSANYHKLDTNLEEAITSSTVNKNTNNVIY